MTTLPPLLRVADLCVRYPAATSGWTWFRSRDVRAVDGVSFDVAAGETLVLVGETGCGKSSVVAAVMRMARVTSGRIELDGRDLTTRNPLVARGLRRRVQPLPFDPRAALSPRRPLADSIGEPLRAAGIARGRRLREIVQIVNREVGLTPAASARLPHRVPPMDCVRAVIARALVFSPDLLVADEPFCTLDTHTRHAALELIDELRATHELALLVTTRDLHVARRLGGRVALLERGVIVEQGPTARVLGDPLHPYTRALVAAAPKPDPAIRVDRIPLPPPTPVVGRPQPGCRFRERCPAAAMLPPLAAVCAGQRPPMRHSRDGRSVRCLLFGGTDGQEGEAELQADWADALTSAGMMMVTLDPRTPPRPRSDIDADVDRAIRDGSAMQTQLSI